MLRSAFRASGGLARGDDLGRLLENQHGGDFVTLADLIGSHDVFGFEWRAMLWVPMFQFELCDLSLKRCSRMVLAELSAVFDRWMLALWFAEPNSWLSDRRPVDVLDANLPSVLRAARTDRFIATG